MSNHCFPYDQHFVLSKEKREGGIVTYQAKNIINPQYRCGIQLVFVSHLSDTQRAQVCAIYERMSQKHFICPYFPFKTKPQFSSLPMAKF